VSGRRCEGCGEPLAADARSNLRTCKGSSRCRVRAHRARSRVAAAADTYLDALAELVGDGAIEPWAALELAICPRSTVLARIAGVAA
jgi:hypothetical protein